MRNPQELRALIPAPSPASQMNTPNYMELLRGRGCTDTDSFLFINFFPMPIVFSSKLNFQR